MSTPMNICRRPLENSDFNTYDMVADGKLHLGEMPREKFECFIEQLIRTNDREVLKTFTDAIQNNLWEAIKKELLRAAKRSELSQPIQQLIRSLRRHEFSNKVVTGEASVAYNFLFSRSKNSASGVNSRESQQLHQLSGMGILNINAPFSRWRLKSKVLAVGLTGWGYISKDDDANSSLAITRRSDRPSGIQSYSSVVLIKRNSRFKSLFEAGADRFWNALPDQLMSWIVMGGSLTLRKPFKSGFALEASALWSKIKYAEPLDPTYYRRREEKISAGIETSYLFKHAGLVLTYNINDQDITSSFYVRSQNTHSPSLLAHFMFTGGYIRIGGGGGIWDGALKLWGESDATRARGGEAHGNIDIQWQPRKWLSTRFKAKAMAYHGTGDYNGWYPLWESEASLMLHFSRCFAKISGTYSGHLVRLEKTQEKHQGGVIATVQYRPSNSWNLSLTAQYLSTLQTGHQAYAEQTISAKPAIGLLLSSNPDIWLQINGEFQSYDYRQNNIKRNQINASVNASTKLRF